MKWDGRELVKGGRRGRGKMGYKGKGEVELGKKGL